MPLPKPARAHLASAAGRARRRHRLLRRGRHLEGRRGGRNRRALGAALSGTIAHPRRPARPRRSSVFLAGHSGAAPRGRDRRPRRPSAYGERDTGHRQRRLRTLGRPSSTRLCGWILRAVLPRSGSARSCHPRQKRCRSGLETPSRRVRTSPCSRDQGHLARDPPSSPRRSSRPRNLSLLEGVDL